MKVIDKILSTITIMLLIIFMVMCIYFMFTTINTIKTYNKYDLNDDGKVNALDLLILQKYILEEDTNEN